MREINAPKSLRQDEGGGFCALDIEATAVDLDTLGYGHLNVLRNLSKCFAVHDLGRRMDFYKVKA